ncbi:hypothetical protein CFC21_024750 [Triticum aestivum]|uniref:Uncharacterized protein n=3 Tax=Triticum TaxID=4564 RepID=A0A9R1RR00_TRITD|nr:uncharacterized protein LOC119365128 [Triticum dicoccoides]XP_044325475.1 uncharacterized protein LOC123046236 [Triticum aestivum]KAF7010328.1 hypothetical protein CFC21_024750 [Triticum aestivum]VAH50245.1 unnamed protein product [Triticum turgidum subsp. durum]
MALLHPAPATSLPTCHHRQNAGVLIQQPSRRRFRLNAQRKPGSTSTSPRTGTPSGSESDNVVLKAAWYGSEALGIAASFFRPPSPEADAGAADDGTSESQPVGRAQVAEAIKDDFARSYFVTGNLTLGAYEDDCEFADPAGSFRGLQRFKRNCTNFGSLLEKSNMKLTKWEDVEDKSIGHWRFSCVMSFPWRPILSATGYTEYYFDAESGKVCRHVENWNVPKMALLRQIFRPSRWVWEKEKR